MENLATRYSVAADIVTGQSRDLTDALPQTPQRPLAYVSESGQSSAALRCKSSLISNSSLNCT